MSVEMKDLQIWERYFHSKVEEAKSLRHQTRPVIFAWLRASSLNSCLVNALSWQKKTNERGSQTTQWFTFCYLMLPRISVVWCCIPFLAFLLALSSSLHFNTYLSTATNITCIARQFDSYILSTWTWCCKVFENWNFFLEIFFLCILSPLFSQLPLGVLYKMWVLHQHFLPLRA